MKLAHDPILDPIIQQSVEGYHQGQSLSAIDLESWQKEKYTITFKDWIQSSSYNSIHGLDSFAYESYCAGAVDGIASFIHRHVTTKRLRFSRAEFVGSKIASNHAKANFTWLEDDKLKDNDAVILSVPFSGTGCVHSDYDKIIKECNQKNIPVLIDLAYFAISYDIEIDLDQPCITDVVFSLSKCFSTSLRLGYRLTKEHNDDLVQVSHDLKLVNRWAVNTGTQLMQNFSHNWIVDRLRPVQLDVCRDLNLIPSNTLTLAQGNKQLHSDFERNGFLRICITDELHQRL